MNLYYNYCVVLVLVFNFLLAFMKLFLLVSFVFTLFGSFSICVTVQYNQRNDLPLCWSLFLYTWIKSVEKTFALFSRYIYIIIVCFILFCYLFCYFNYQYLYINLWVFFTLNIDMLSFLIVFLNGPNIYLGRGSLSI